MLNDKFAGCTGTCENVLCFRLLYGLAFYLPFLFSRFLSIFPECLHANYVYSSLLASFCVAPLCDDHLWMRWCRSTSACSDGITTIVTLRCGEIEGASNTSARVQIPPNCAVGTCDGCQYHFMLISPLACPICRMEDYHRIVGGCFGGVMEVTLLPPKWVFCSFWIFLSTSSSLADSISLVWCNFILSQSGENWRWCCIFTLLK